MAGLDEDGACLLFHTGMIVDDVAAAAAQLSAAFGYQWTPAVEVRGFINTPEGPKHRVSRIAHSLQGPHHLEIIEHVNGAAWKTVACPSQVHHVGFATENLDAAVARAVAAGFVDQFAILDQDGVTVIAHYMFTSHGGLWIELCDRSRYVALLDRIAEGQNQAGLA